MNYIVKVNEVKKQESNMKVFTDVVFGYGFKVCNIVIVKNKEGNLFVSMPSYKTNQEINGKPVYQDICYPITKKFREKLYGALEQEYEEVKEVKVRQEEEQRIIESAKLLKPGIETEIANFCF